jgi:hypothetical protein
VLVQAAADAGLDPAQVRADLASNKDVAEVEQEVQAAKEAGIQSVPVFIFGGKFAVSGAQAPEYLPSDRKGCAGGSAGIGQRCRLRERGEPCSAASQFC